jgi:hypothetical protein
MPRNIGAESRHYRLRHATFSPIALKEKFRVNMGILYLGVAEIQYF